MRLRNTVTPIIASHPISPTSVGQAVVIVEWIYKDCSQIHRLAGDLSGGTERNAGTSQSRLQDTIDCEKNLQVLA